MVCNKCNNKAVQDGLCYKHYTELKESEFTDNTDIDNLGIIKWAKYFLPHHVYSSFPPKHKLIYAMLLNLYSSKYKNKYERLRALRAFREYSKTGTIRIFTLYTLMHNKTRIKIPILEFEYDKGNNIKDIKIIDSEEIFIDEKFIVIVSETGAQAEEFTTAIRDEIASNSLIHYFYGDKIIEEVEQEGLMKITDRKSKMQWTRRAFKVKGVNILGIGAKQRIRGRIKGASRPTTMFFDDIYSEENVKTKESRESVRNWFNNAAIKTVDMIKGKIYLVGTIVNDDTVIVDIKKNPQWKSIEIPLMPLDKLNKLVNNHLEVDTIQGICKIPYEEDTEKCREYFNKLQQKEDWGLEWSERIGLYETALMYKEAVYNRGISGFYQEYFHIIIPEEDKRFRREYFRRITAYEIKTEENITKITYEYEGKQIELPVNLYIGIDLGTGTISGDDTVLILTGVTSENKYIITDIKAGKYSYFDTSDKEGIYDIIARYCRKYRIRSINVGYAGSERGHIEGLRQYLTSNNIRVTVTGRKQHYSEGTKEERIINNLLHLYQQGRIYHTNCNNIDKLEYQLEYLGKADRDDIADALEVSIYNSIKPFIKHTDKEDIRINKLFNYNPIEEDYINYWRN